MNPSGWHLYKGKVREPIACLRCPARVDPHPVTRWTDTAGWMKRYDDAKNTTERLCPACAKAITR